MAIFYDTHAHLDYPDFQEDFAGMIERARAAGIAKMISIGTDFESSSRSLQLSEQYPNIHAVVGWHPTNVMEAPDDIRSKLKELAQHPKVVAIGETGLDYYRLPSQQNSGSAEDDEKYKAKQALIFRQQMEVAADLGLNCVIHQRSAFSDTLEAMKPFAGSLKGVFHCFVDDPGTMNRVLEMGSLVSFTGIATFKNAQTIRDTIAAVPSGKFMLETDSPYLAPVPYRGKRCEPAYVKEIAAVVSATRNCSIDDLSAMTCAAAHEFFPKLGPG